VKELLPELAKTIPPGIDIDVAIDRAGTIRASVHEVEKTLLLSIVLVTLVVFLFLRSIRATAIPATAVPLSLVGTFGVMYVLGYSLDNLSLMALTIATGFVVDDAIVVTENVSRFVEQGVEPKEAALRGAKQIGFTIISITCSLLAVFVPILFMGGAVGRLFREFAVVLAVSILLSAVVSLTLTPMMCSKLLRKEHAPNAISRGLEKGLDVVVRGYAAMLRVVLRHRFVMGLVTVATVVATVWLYFKVPSGLFPQQDTGMVTANVQGPQDMSFVAMRDRMEKLIKIVKDDPDVLHVNANVGGFGTSTTNTGRMFIMLKDRDERESSADQVIDRLRPKLAKVHGQNSFLSSVQDVRIGGRLAPHAVPVHARVRRSARPRRVGAEADQRDPQAPRGHRRLDRPAIQRAAARPRDRSRHRGPPRHHRLADRQHAVRRVRAAAGRDLLHRARAVPRHPRGEARRRAFGPDALDKLYVTSQSGLVVPLSDLVKVTPTNVALSVAHQGQFPRDHDLVQHRAERPAVRRDRRDRANLDGDRVPGQHPRLVRRHREGVRGLARHPAQADRDRADLRVHRARRALRELRPPADDPVDAALGRPGRVAHAWLLGTGLFDHGPDRPGVVLIGIVKKNGILMIDFALEAQRVRGLPPEEAIYEACVTRFRPIIMTTLAALLGAVPLMLGAGPGAELRQPLGIAVVGGLLVSQALTLFTTPIIYLYLERFFHRPTPTPALATTH
jgi:multidrug efflux pump subunit AcrB